MDNEEKTKSSAGSWGLLWVLVFLLVGVGLIFSLVDAFYHPSVKEKTPPAAAAKPPSPAESSKISANTFKELLRATVDTLAASRLEDFNLPDHQDTLLAGVSLKPAGDIAADGWHVRVIMQSRQGFDLQFGVTLNTTESAKEFRKKIARSLSPLLLKAAPVLRRRAAFESPAAIVQFAQSAQALRPYAVNAAIFENWLRDFIYAHLNEMTGEAVAAGFSLRPQELMEFHRHLNAIYRGLGDIVVHKCLAALCRLPASTPRWQNEKRQLKRAAEFLAAAQEQMPRDHRTLFQLWGRFLAAKLGTAKSFETAEESFRAIESAAKPKLLTTTNPVMIAPGFSIDAIYQWRSTTNWPEAANAYFRATPFWAAMTEKLGASLRANPRLGARAKLFFRQDQDAVSLSPFLKAQGENLIAAVTGTYTSTDTTVVGLAYLNGELIGGLVQEWAGFCLISKTGRLCLVDWHDLDLARVAAALQIPPAKDTSAPAPSKLKIFFKPEDYAAFIHFIETNQLSVIQGHLLLHRRQIAVNPGEQPFSRRLLVQFDNDDFGLIDLQGTELDKRLKTFTLAEAAAIAQALNASEAMNLDMGAWNWGVLKIGAQQVELGAPIKTMENRLTNALILYTETEQVK